MLKLAIGEVVAGKAPEESIGTAFLVADNYALTALHVVGDPEQILAGQVLFHDPINIRFGKDEGEKERLVKAEVVANYWDAHDDWVLLKLQEPLRDVAPIPLGIVHDGATPPFYSYGFPVEHHNPLMVTGKVTNSRARYFKSTALQLICDHLAGEGSPLNGLSGAPCIVGSIAIGIIRAHPIKRTFTGSTHIVAVRNGVLYATPLDLVAIRCEGLIPTPALLTHESLQRALNPEPHIASLRSYEAAVQEYSHTLPYDPIPDGMAVDNRLVYTGLNASILSEGNGNSATGPATDLVAGALKQRKIVIVIGPPGAGKTSLFQYLSEVLWNKPESAGFDRPRIVIYCRLRDIAKTSGTISQRIRAAMVALPTFAQDGASPPDDFLASWPEQKKTPLLFLFDSLDEVPDEERANVLMWLRQVLNQPSSITAECVISSRYKELLDNTWLKHGQSSAATYITLASPTREQALAIASSWIQHSSVALVNEMERVGLGEVLLTPLGIALSAQIYAKTKALPTSKAEVYRRYVEYAVDRKVTHIQELSNLSRPVKVQLITQLLKRIAWHMTVSLTLDESGVIHSIVDELGEWDKANRNLATEAARAKAASYYRMLAESSGILMGSLEWKHETFREYLAAAYLQEKYSPNSLAVYRSISKYKNPQWQGVILFLFSIWAIKASAGPEASLEQYRGVFSLLIGKRAFVRPSRVARILAKFKSNIATLLKSITHRLKASQELSDLNIPSPPPDTSWQPISSFDDEYIFAAKALGELGAAPKNIESKIVRFVLSRENNIGIGVCSAAARVFVDHFTDYEYILRRWSYQPRLRQLMDPWITQWRQAIITYDQARELKGIYSEPKYLIGLLFLCRSEKVVQDLLCEKPLREQLPSGVIAALKNYSIGDSTNYFRRLALQALREASCVQTSSSTTALEREIQSSLYNAPVELLIEELKEHSHLGKWVNFILETIAKKNDAVNRLAELCDDSALPLALRIRGMELLVEHEDTTERSIKLIPLYTEYLVQHPGEPVTLRARAKALERLERYQEAERDLDAVISRNPSDGQALEGRARIRYLQDNYDAALEDIEKALMQPENKSDRSYLKGSILYFKGEYAESIDSLYDAEALGNRLYTLFYRRSGSYFQLGLLDEAIKDVDVVLADNKSDVAARRRKAAYLSCLGKWEESEVLLKGLEGSASDEIYWTMTILQNTLGLRGSKKALEFIAGLPETYVLSEWEQTVVLFLEKAMSGKVPEKRVFAISKSWTAPFWIHIATNDENGCKASLVKLFETGSYSTLRWIVIERKTLNPFLPVWALPLVDRIDQDIHPMTQELRLKYAPKQCG